MDRHSVRSGPQAQRPARLQPPAAGQDAWEYRELLQALRHSRPETLGLLLAAGAAGLWIRGPLPKAALLLGAVLFWPGNARRLEAWLERRAKGLVRGGLRRIQRLLGDRDRRYPSTGRAP
ncbi:hypothetical protein [Candidatus Methylocalor cossyra]|uniref:TIGR02611 family protein n=1 Tax=Candidatus Methylocalor cossyra TaxID=3108543 RepID=A0ABP1CB26_9GAMM